MLEIDYSRTNITDDDIQKYAKEVKKIDKKLEKMSKNPQEMVGWLFLPTKHDKEEVLRVKKAAEKINKQSDVLLVVGIGGSYMGARAVVKSMKGQYVREGETEVIFIGHNLSTQYLNSIIDYIRDKDISINLISKTGTTTEPMIAYRIFNEILIEKYGIEEARERTYITTDLDYSNLKKIGEEESYEMFNIPTNISGRFSVLTPVGLLPIAAAGIDIDKLLKGAQIAEEKYRNENLMDNNAYKFAVVRYLLNRRENKNIDITCAYESSLDYILEWIRQLLNESEGKNDQAIFTTITKYTSSLHSIGQIIQDGRKNIFETVINFDDMNTEDLIIPGSENNIGNLNYLKGKDLDYVNKTVMEAVMNAHFEGDVPNILISLKKLDEENLGELLYFYMKACTMYCMLLDINPFNHPGVENYKNSMYRLLDKPGFEKKN